MSVFHTVYGLRLASNIAIPGLAVQSEPKTADVRLSLKEPFPRILSGSLDYFYTSPVFGGREQPNLRVARDSHLEYYAFFYRDGARFAVRRDAGEVWADWPEDYTLEDACTYLLGPIMGFVLRLRGTTCLHASSVALGDCAIALTGFPGAGKSTLAAEFARNGCPVLSDDVIALTDKGEKLLVQLGYPRLNLWPDSVRILFGSENALPSITATWNKRYLSLDQNGCRFATESLPLGVIYVLGAREAVPSDPVIEEVAGAEALMVLVGNTYVNYLLDREMRRQEFDLLGRVVATVPIRCIHPSANRRALGSLREAIVADAMQLAASQYRLANTHCD